jgi:hypothetical protein
MISSAVCAKLAAAIKIETAKSDKILILFIKCYLCLQDSSVSNPTKGNGVKLSFLSMSGKLL